MKPIAFFPDDSSLVVILPVTLTFSASLYRCVETSARSSRLDNHCAASPMLWMFTCCQSRLRGSVRIATSAHFETVIVCPGY